MADYWDVVQFRELPSGKKFAVRLGSAKQRDDGGFNVYLNALPMPDAKGCSFTIAPQREKPGMRPPPSAVGYGQRREEPRAGRGRDFDDDLPF